MSQILSLLTLIAKGINAICRKVKLDRLQDRYRRVDDNPSGEFLNTFGVRKSKDDKPKTDTGKHNGE